MKWLPPIAVLALLTACGGSQLPIERLKSSLQDQSTYSILLEDMKGEGNFFKKYYHKYRVVQADESWISEWLEVPKDYYRDHQNFLGMSLAASKEGEESNEVAPPGYQYVGDKRYGRWRTDSHGRSFWEFYGQYAFFSTLFGGWYRPIYSTDYDGYLQHRRRGAPYYGRGNVYGTSGSVVQKTKPNFYQRHVARSQVQRASFKDKVAKRVGRTRTGYRSRGGRIGK
jgi:hypothetical protein